MDEKLPDTATRRKCLAAAAAAGTTATAGCVGGLLSSSGGAYDCPSGDGETVSEGPQPALGPTPDEAAVTVKVWEDFSCPHCATFSLEVVPRIRDEYVSGGEVRYEHHDFPIPVRDWAWDAASAGRAVLAAADAEGFFEYAKTVYETQGDYRTKVVGDAADAVGVEPCTAVTAATAETYRPLLEADKQAGLDTGIQGTPGIVVDGNLVEGNDFESVSAAIEDAL
ncbi:DsbA family protein [Halobaculum sp. MBLA0147]|uniref:DsbA family protein n=1 Tax=Halobaculum sp. MBLA0147 TaxID=3079934 RepID=UPI003524783A